MNMLKLILSIVLLSAYFGGTNAENYLIREDRIWTYEGLIPVGPFFEFKMRFEGDSIADGKKYNILRSFDCMTWDWGEEKKAAQGRTFLLREENGRIYLHAPSEYDNPWQIDESEALLYDFNAAEGSELMIIDNGGCLSKASVTSSTERTVNDKSFKMYTFSFTDRPDMPYTVVQDLGLVSMGCIPLIIAEISTGGSGKDYILPPTYIEHNLIRVTDLEGDVICERDADGLWPWERKDGVTELAAASQLSFDGKTATADGKPLSVYAISGKVVAEGCGEVSTESLQPGVYIAKAGTKTLKILVK